MVLQMLSMEISVIENVVGVGGIIIVMKTVIHRLMESVANLMVKEE